MDQFKYSEGIIISILGSSKYKYFSVITPNGNGLKTKKIRDLKIYCTIDYCEIGPVLISETVPSDLTSLNENDIKSAFFISLKSKGTYISKKYTTNANSPFLAECPNLSWMNKNNGIKFKYYKFINDIYGKTIPSAMEWLTGNPVNLPEMLSKNIFTPLIPDKYKGTIHTCFQIRTPNNEYFSWGYELTPGEESAKMSSIKTLDINDDFAKGKLLCVQNSASNANSQPYLHFLIIETHDDYDEAGRVVYYLNNPPKRYHYKSRVLVFHIDDIKNRYDVKGLKQDAAAIQPKCFYEVENYDNLKAHIFVKNTFNEGVKHRKVENTGIHLFEIKKNAFVNNPHEIEMTLSCQIKNHDSSNLAVNPLYVGYYSNYILPKFSKSEGIERESKIFGNKITENSFKIKEFDFSHYGPYKCIGETLGDQQTTIILEKDTFLILPEDDFIFNRQPAVEKNKVNSYCRTKYEYFAKLDEVKILNGDNSASVKLQDLQNNKFFGYTTDKNNVEYKSTVEENDILLCSYSTHYNTTFTVTTMYDKEFIKKLNGPNGTPNNDKWPFIVVAVVATVLLVIAVVVAFTIVRKRRRRRQELSMMGSVSSNSDSRLSLKSGLSKSKVKKSRINNSVVSKSGSCKTGTFITNISKADTNRSSTKNSKTNNNLSALSKSNKTKSKT
uniref:Ig-like domain-containing protein n=1 Tax=Parastrongyloides trichosuri TaxID=131310 RepID=A0A0N4ZQE3_PARTI